MRLTREAFWRNLCIRSAATHKLWHSRIELKRLLCLFFFCSRHWRSYFLLSLLFFAAKAIFKWFHRRWSLNSFFKNPRRKGDLQWFHRRWSLNSFFKDPRHKGDLQRFHRRWSLASFFKSPRRKGDLWFLSSKVFAVKAIFNDFTVGDLWFLSLKVFTT